VKRFIQGADRTQSTLLPDCLDDFIAADNPVRAVDAFVEELDLKELDFAGAEPAATGRPAYHPAVLLKLYIYGYLNRVPSSRRLEREAQRNVELMWLTGRLTPDFKTIADFRRDNGPGIRNACRRFVQLCRDLALFSEAIVAIDSSKFKAVNSRDRNFTPTKIERRQQQIEESIQRYLEALETADRTQRPEVEAKTGRLREKIDTLRQQMRRMQRLKAQLKNEPDQQRSLTDPDARAMMSQAKGTGIVGYNVQAAVDTQHHLIVTHEVTNVGNDRQQLAKMAVAAREAMGKTKLQALADRGYFSSPEIKAAADAGITPLVPKPMTSNAKAEGRFNRDDFIYLKRSDAYQCPAGERAPYRYSTVENGLVLKKYWSSACPRCPLKPKCTTGDARRISRWEHEEVLEAMQRRLDRNLDAMTLRRRTVEHVFGTLKHWMGSTHFLTRGLKNVSTEMSLQVLAYNMKRVIQILGMDVTMKVMKVASA
jgi:transposase